MKYLGHFFLISKDEDYNFETNYTNDCKSTIYGTPLLLVDICKMHIGVYSFAS